MWYTYLYSGPKDCNTVPDRKTEQRIFLKCTSICLEEIMLLKDGNLSPGKLIDLTWLNLWYFALFERRYVQQGKCGSKQCCNLQHVFRPWTCLHFFPWCFFLSFFLSSQISQEYKRLRAKSDLQSEHIKCFPRFLLFFPGHKAVQTRWVLSVILGQVYVLLPLPCLHDLWRDYQNGHTRASRLSAILWNCIQT